jgi:hypothetical protein
MHPSQALLLCGLVGGRLHRLHAGVHCASLERRALLQLGTPKTGEQPMFVGMMPALQHRDQTPCRKPTDPCITTIDRKQSLKAVISKFPTATLVCTGPNKRRNCSPLAPLLTCCMASTTTTQQIFQPVQVLLSEPVRGELPVIIGCNRDHLHQPRNIISFQQNNVGTDVV